ncbi:MAG TPA: DUF1614 domain-containing protein [Methylomirabilota bacterium]|nr:DUF1614 domain-containing protein [Methylomirabilota bacterium]
MILPLALPLLLVGFVVLLILLVVMIELRVLAYAYRKIGVRPRYMVAVLLLSLLGSHVNIPLYSVSVPRLTPPEEITIMGRTYIVPPAVEPGATVVAINVGGGLLPILLSLYLFLRLGMRTRMLIGTAIVAVLVHGLARVVPGIGIAVPMLLPPLVAAAVGLVLAFRRAPPVAYVAGSMGTLIGADLTNLHRIAELGAPIVSIGGAGTFDGVFLTGIIAGLIT